jgi:uncharacterized protein YndB with AHSA1/START domain/ketosteroid isomerase-like protein
MTQPVLGELSIERMFDAPRTLVFAHWVEAEHLGAWFAPAGFDVVDCLVDPRAGGRWRAVYRSTDGASYVEHGEFIEILAPERLRFTLINEDSRGQVMFRTDLEVTFQERDGKTTMVFSQRGFVAQELLDSVKIGWGSCFAKMDHQLAAELEVRALYDEWFRASERKDLDATMASIAADVVSYEHEMPLVFRGADGLRESCKLGFDSTPDGLRWDVPDLRVLVRGDLAITWGLNHMHGPGVEMWSRGTRVFQKIDGRWQMIHQHVSFPFDPASGAAKMDLQPSTDH